MFAAIPPLLGLLVRYYISTEAIKFATGTERKDWIKMSLDISEQIGNAYQARVLAGQASPITAPPWSPEFLANVERELVTIASGALGAPGTAAEVLGFTFPGAAAKQRGRLEAEVTGGFPFTRERIKGAPKFVKRKLSTWNRDVKKAYAEVKKRRNVFGVPGRMPADKKKAFGKITKAVAALRKGRKAKTTVDRQIVKALGASLKATIKKFKAEKKKRKK